MLIYCMFLSKKTHMILVYVTNSRINFDSTSYNRQMVTTACSYQEKVGSLC